MATELDHSTNRQATPTDKALAVAAYINGKAVGTQELSQACIPDKVQDLSDATSQPSISALAAQLPILQAMFHRLALEAAANRVPSQKAMLNKAALNAQASYTKTVALLAALSLQSKGHGRIQLDDELWN